MGKPEVEAFLTMLANERQVSLGDASAGLKCTAFPVQESAGPRLAMSTVHRRPPERKRIPAVLTVAEVHSVLALVDGVEGVLARLLYGTGMRLAEWLSLRVKHVDFKRQVIVVRSGKGDKDRVVMLPRVLALALREQLARSRASWAADRASERSGVYLPHEMDAKYPRAGQT